MGKRYDKALTFAKLAHGKAKRKYTGEPYWWHVKRVAGWVKAAHGTPEMVVAAYLHDVLEDTAVTRDELVAKFGTTVTNYVCLLTEPKAGTRAERKAFVVARMVNAPGAVKTIKLADIIDNGSNLSKLDPEFWVTWRAEKLALLPSLKGGDPILFHLVENMLR